MKRLVLPALFWFLCLPLMAQSAGEWVGYITYAPRPETTTVRFDAAGLKWLEGIASKLGPDGFSYLGRRDSAHWLALATKKGLWTLQVHDESALFNFEGLVSQKTGLLTVEKGVSWRGLGRKGDAEKSATIAVAYAEKARIAKDLFSMESPMAPQTKMPPKAMTAAPKMVPTSIPVPAKRPAPKAVKVDSPSMAVKTMTVGPASPADDPWRRLVDGNLRFVSGKVMHPDQSMKRVEETAKHQKPFAIVVSCSDSPAPPELVFDQGIGDLYVIRTAGEVVSDVELGSIEYAVENLGVSAIIVMGEKDCPAVSMTLKGGDFPPYLEAVAAQIRPAAEAARFQKGNILDYAVRENIRNVAAKIKATPVLGDAIMNGTLNLKAAYYDTDTGKVAALP